METNNFNFVQSQEDSATLSKTFLANVFSWMFAALAITSVVAYYFGNNMDLLSLLVNTQRGGLTGLGYFVMFAPIIFVFAMGLGFNRFSYPVILFLFLIYSAIMGASLSFIFMAYTPGSIFGTFAAASGMFGLMAVVGYTTNTDLSRFGSIMFMGLIGIIVASIINWFLKSSGLDYMISFVGVLVFTGLVAYDVQKLKRIGAGVEFAGETTKKLVIMGALSLYLDFINLFLFLLRLFGNRK